MTQTHEKFKLFSGPFDSANAIQELGKEMEKWVLDAGIAPKSIGIEYLESTKTLLTSLGYRDDGPPCPVKISCEFIGKVDAEANLTALESALGAAAARHPKIICHELFVTETKDLYMVLMTEA